MSRPAPIIRPFEQRDAEPLAALLRSLWAHDPTMLALYGSMHRVWQAAPLIRQTLVAAVDDTPIGAGTLFESTIHPRMLMVTLNVAEQWQRQGIGSWLWAALGALGNRRPWLAKLTGRDPAGISFLRRRGFRRLAGTLSGVLDPAQAAVQEWLRRLPEVPAGYRILKIDAAPATLAEVALLHAAIYRQAHGWNPPIEESAAAALAHYCGPNVLPGSQLCVYCGEKLVGAANLIANPFQPSDHEAYLVNLGTVELPPADAELLTGALIRESLRLAAERGLRLRFEADDAHQPFQSWLLHAPAAERDPDFVIMGNS
jgi:GNAT superfamily N-acetyltransferase